MDPVFLEVKHILDRYNKDLDDLKKLIQNHEKRMEKLSEIESKSTSGEKK